MFLLEATRNDMHREVLWHSAFRSSYVVAAVWAVQCCVWLSQSPQLWFTWTGCRCWESVCTQGWRKLAHVIQFQWNPHQQQELLLTVSNTTKQWYFSLKKVSRTHSDTKFGRGGCYIDARQEGFWLAPFWERISGTVFWHVTKLPCY
jgi:hypothetical protein